MATPTRVQGFGGTGTTGATATATLTAGNFVLAVAASESGTLTISDGTNTYTPVSGGTTNAKAWTAPITASGVTSVVLAGGATKSALACLEVTGQVASPLDAASTTSATGIAGAIASPATGTPANINELAVGLLARFSGAVKRALSSRSFSPALGSQSDETEQNTSSITDEASASISDGPLASVAATTFSAVQSASGDTWYAWCLLVQGSPTPTSAFLASVGHPGPRLPMNTFRQGGY